MNGKELHDCAKAYAETIPGSEADFPFGPDHLVYRVEKKIFLFVSEVHGQHVITVKTEPEQGMINRQIFAGIKGGYHMNKKHWITVLPDSDVDESLVRDLVRASYQEVVKNLPKSKRLALLKV